MIVNIKALIVVFTVSIAVLLYFRPALSALVGSKRYVSWACLWLLATASVFVIPQYWVFVVALAALCFWFSRSEPITAALFALLVVAAPTHGLNIPGFLGINRFIGTNPQTIMIIALLAPALLAAKHMKKISKAGALTDAFFLMWLLLQLGLAMRAPSFTHLLRLTLEAFLAIAPIYYVFSRQPKSLQDIRAVTTAFVLGVLIIGATTLPETVMTWHFYTSAASSWVGDIGMAYKLREGALRATGSSTNPIVWGFIAMCGLGLALAVLNDRCKPIYKYAGFSLLALGLLTSLSRGPWVGAFAVVFFFVATGAKSVSRMAQIGAGGVVILIASSFTSAGKRILDLLPFVGGSANDTITYRQQLLRASREVIAENPLFGSQDYLQHPKLQAMRQGEGIIDIVNSYIQVLLQSGFVGLFIFLGLFSSALLALHGAAKSARRYDPQLALYCRAYLATLLGVMLTIFTTSIVEQMSFLLWMLVGGAIALVRIERVSRDAPQRGAASGDTSEAHGAAPVAYDWK